MTPPESPESPIEAGRKAIFAALVALQDRGVSVAASRLKVAESFHVGLDLVVAVEQEGIENEWPPL